MSLIIHKNAYQDFLNLLLEWQREMKSDLLTANESSIEQETKLIRAEIWQNLKQLFQQRIVTLTDEELDLAVASRWISLQAEIQREFRLLETDWLFFLSSRQSATKQARHKNICDRTDRLIGYCQAVLEIG